MGGGGAIRGFLVFPLFYNHRILLYSYKNIKAIKLVVDRSNTIFCK